MPRPEPAGLALAPRHLSQLQALLQSHVPDAEVWAFGSRVVGGAHEGSDLDLVLRNALDPSSPVAGGAELREALQMSLLPMLVDVLDWAHLPAPFREGIAHAHLVLQAPRVQASSGEVLDGAR